jgi:uncharacterized membrane protein HdeD (DUF308 family)
MIIKILGFFDIVAGILLFLTPFVSISKTILLMFALYLVVKGAFFLITGGIGIFALTNMGDILAGLMFYLAVPFALPKILLALVSLFLVQKGILSYF